ncbi:MAG: cation:proton antiporter [Deltaproteobacteria bacterium]|nr:cation:proton antiporter [Deltaproteobacteria bacterium]
MSRMRLVAVGALLLFATGAGAETSLALRSVLGLLALLALAFLAAHPAVQRAEELLGISQVVAAGLPFFVLGAIAHLPSVGLLTDEVLLELGPLLDIGLGWVGVLAGLQLDLRAIARWSPLTRQLSSVVTFVPFVVVGLAMGALLHVAEIPATDHRLVRDAVAFGAVGCLAAPTAAALLSASGLGADAVQVVRNVARLDDLLGVAVLAILSAFFRPTASVGWSLPPIGWLFVTLGMGLGLGLITYVALRAARSDSEGIAVLLGSVALSAGAASVFSVSPIVTCFVVGFVLANLPLPREAETRAALTRLERPVYLLFLFVAGSLWRFDLWLGWVMLPAFVVARLLARLAAVRFARWRGLLSHLPGEERPVSRALVSAPIGALSIAIVVNVQTLYPGRAVPLMVTAVVGGSLFSEALVHLLFRVFATDARPRGST